MLRTLKQTALAALTALSVPLVAAEPPQFDVNQIKWEMTRYSKIVDRGGKKYILVQVPKGAKDIANKNCAFFNIDLAPFAGYDLEFSVKARGRNISEPAQSFNGGKVMLYFQDRNGREYWPGAAVPRGTFDWTTIKVLTMVPKGAHSGRFRLGLQESSGEIEFDLSSFKVGVPGIEKEEKLPLTPDLARELDLIESRMRAELLKGKVATPEEVREVLAKQNPDGTFNDIDYNDDNRSAWRVAKHLGNAHLLARVWATKGHEYYHDKKVGEAVQKAVDWWGRNRPISSNWWWNDMSVPQTLGNIMLAAPELFPEGELRTRALIVCRQAKYLPRYTGNNLVFIAQNIFRRALLERNVAPLTKAAGIIAQEIRMAPVHNKTEWAFGGIRADGCYHQHGPQVQFGNYGGEFFSNIAYWSNIWEGTRWQLTPEQWQVMRHLSFDGFQWILWNGDMDLLACGRQLGENAAHTKGLRTITAFEKLRAADPGDKAPYDAVLKRNAEKVNTLVGNRHFWNSDMMVHRRPDWYATLRMNSVRVRPIEDDTNWDNSLGRYFSDGVCLVTRTGKEYDNITAVWDWTRLPGTTLPATPIISTKNRRWTLSQKGTSRQLGETAFVGGVTDGIRGAAVFTMDLDGVKAKKAYFFDTDAIYQLGAGITSTVPYGVETTVNCCIRNGEIKQGKNWFHHDGIGYRGENIRLLTGERTGDWRILEGGRTEPKPETKDLFQLRIDHGVKPENATYSFAILPDATPEETANWNKGKVLSNTETCQAVEFNDGTIGAIFHAPGKLDNFETKAPGAFLIKGKKVLAVDPSAKLQEITIVLDKVSKSVKLPDGEMEGTAVEVEF